MKKVVSKLLDYLTALLSILTLRILLRAIIVGSIAFAIPEGGVVTNGVATISSPDSQTVQIKQSSDKAIIQWNSFNIGSSEKTQFVQPSTSSVALNRINPGQGVSQIYGTLTANGNIILVNPAGIYFGPSAYVNVGGLIASTSNISNENFLAGKYIFNEPSSLAGSIINEGNIIAQEHGLIALLGTGVVNRGYIQAKLGTVLLGAGSKFTIAFAGNQLINFTVDESTPIAGVDNNGNKLSNGVLNEGKIIANGGVIFVRVEAAQHVLDNAINMQGIAEAHSVAQHGGEIIFSGGTEGTVRVSGVVTVSSRKSQGGTINILGKRIIIESPAIINASGGTGGGTILIGGNAHGAGPQQNADYTFIGANTNILANAILRGDGGKIVIWSNVATQFYGNISVTGGAQGGNGGWIETSSANYLDVNGGRVNALAHYGNPGTWLLDPTNIYIALNQANATAAGMTGTDTSANSSTGVNPQTFAGAGAVLDSLLTTSNLTAALNTANVIVTTTNASGTGVGNITIVDPFSWSSANTLTLTAANNIGINGAITTGAAGSALILNATGNVTQTAAIGGSGGLTQQGAGTTTLTQVNTYGGATAVNAGSLIFNGSGSAASSSGFTVNEGATLTLDNTATNVIDRISGPLTLAGGEFVFKGSNVAATNASETMGILNLPSNYSTITMFSGTGGSTILTFASLNRSAGATVLFRGIGQTNNQAPGAGIANIRFTTVPSVANTQLVGGGALNSTSAPMMPFAFGDTSTSGTGIGFVTYDNGTNNTGMRNLITGTEYIANSFAAGAAGDNVRISAATNAANRTINSLLIVAGGTVNYAANVSLVITSGAVGSTGGSGITSTNSTSRVLTFGAKEAIFHAINSFPIQSAITGTGGLTLSGPGTVTMSVQTKAISGGLGLVINSGSLTSGFASAFASQPVTVNAGGIFNLAGFSDAITTLTLQSGATAGGSVTTGAGTLTLGGDVTLNVNGSGATGATIAGNLALGGNRTFTVAHGDASNDLSITALISGVGNNLIKAGSGTLSLSGANIYSGATSVNAGILSLGATTGLGSTTSTTVANNAALDLAFSSGTLANTNTINLNGSGPSGAGALTMSGNSDILNNPITLQTSSTIGGTGTGTFTLGGAITGTGTNLTINLANAGVSLPTTTLTTSGNLSVTTGGAISQAGVLTIPGTSSFTAGANPITLTQNNALTGVITLFNTGANDVSLTTSGAMQLAASTIGRNLTLVTGGAISQTGAITATGGTLATSITATNANTDVLLNTQANNFGSTAITFAGTLGNFRDIGLRNTSATAAMPTNLGSLANLRNLTLLFNNAGIALPTLTLTGGGSASITAGGAITQSGVLTVPGTSSFTAGANPITLTQNNVLTGAVSLSNSGVNNVALINSIALSLGTSSVGSGTLNLTGVGVTQSGAITQAASAGAVTINAGAGAINLPNSGNTFTGAVSLNNSGANAVQLTNSTALVLGASNVGSSTLGLTAGGTISETGAIVQALSAGTVTLSVTAPNSDILLASQPNDFSGGVVYGGTLSNIRDIGRRNINSGAGVTSTNLNLLTNLRNVTLIFDNASAIAPAFSLHNGGNLYVDTSGSLSGGTGGNILQIGAVNVPGTVTFIAGAHSITATLGNTAGGDVFLSNSGNNNVAFTVTGALHMGTSSVGSGTLTLTGLGVTQDGAITQAASAGAATINAGAGVITLNNASNIFTGAVSLNNSGNNAVALSNNAALTLGTSNIGSGTFTLITGGALNETGAITQAPAAGAISIASTAPSTNIDLSTAANDMNGALSFAGTLSNIQDFKLRNVSGSATLPTNLASLVNLRNLTLQFSNAGIIFPALTLHSGGNLSATASGAITETGALIIPGTSSFSAGTNAITLTQNNTFTGAVALTNSGANDVAITTSGALSLDTSSVGSGAFTANSIGVSQIGIFTQASGAGIATFNAGAGAIALTQNNTFTGSVALSNTGANNVALTNSTALSLGTLNIGSGTLDVTAGGTISQTGPITQEANAGITTYTFTAPSSDLLLNLANNTNGFINIGGTLSNLRDVSLRNLGTANQAVVNLQSLTSLRNLTVVLDNVGLSLPALTLHSGGNLILDTSGSLSGGTGGALSQTGVLTVPGTSSFNAGAHAITMTQNNVFTGAVTLTNSGANNVALTNSIALSLGTSSVGSGTLNLTGVGVTQTGTITQASSAGAATINAGAGVITLLNNNVFTGAVSLNNSGANNISLNNLNALNLGTSSVGTGTLAITASGPITESGAITQASGAGAASFTVGANSINLSSANIFTGAVSFSNSGANNIALLNNAALTLGASTVGTGTFGITTTGPITQSGIITQASNAGTATFNSGANPITLALNNLFTGAVSFTNSGANNISFTNNRALILGTSSIGTGTLGITANGAITQTGAITQAASAGAASFSAGANAITLTSSNTFTGAVSLTNSGNNNVALTNSGLLSLGTLNVGSGTLGLTSIGISQTGSITQAASAGLATINAGAGIIDLTNSANSFTGNVSLLNSGANNVALTNNAALTLGTSSVGSGTLGITANGTISESGAITQAASAGAVTLTQNASGADILLNTQPNNFTGSLIYGGTLSNIRDVGIRNINANATLPTNLASLINLRNLTDIFDNSAITLPAISLSGNLSITAGGSITQTGILTVGGTPTFTVTTPGVDILLASNANNFSVTPVITDNGNIRDLALRNVALTAAVPTLPANLRNLTLVFNNAGMTLPSTTLSGNLTLTSNGAIGQSGVLSVNNMGAVTTLSAGAGNNITLTDASNLFATIGITSGNNVSLTNANALNLAASTVSGNFIVNTTGAITQSGILNVTGTSDFSAGALNDITLGSNNVLSTVSIGSGNNVILTNANALNLGTSSISGDLTLSTIGDITQTGAITISGTNKTTIFSPHLGNITLTNPNNNFTNLAITNATDVNITDVNAILLHSSTILGNFTLNTSGAITQTGAIIANGIGKITTLSSGSANDITLNDLNNDFTAITIPSAHDVSLHSTNDLTLNAISSHSLTTSAGGSLTTAGLIQTSGGNVHLTTSAAGTITIGASGIQTSTDQVSPGGSITIDAANTGSLPIAVYLNGALNTQGGTGGVLTVGGGVQQSVAPVVGAGNITVTGNSSAFVLNNNTYTTATVYNIIAQDIIITGLQQSTGAGSDLTFFADSGNSGVGGVRVTTTGGIISSGNLTIKGSDLIINPGFSIELQPGSLIQAAGTISLLGNVGNSNFDIDRALQTTGAGQAITLTPAGTGHIELENNITTNGGNINLNKNLILANNATFTTNGGTISANAIMGAGYTLGLNVGSGTDIALTNASNDFGTVDITSGRNIQLTDINDIDLGVSTISGNLNVTAGGDITNSGTLSVAGTSTLTASAGNITLTQAGNDFNRVAVPSANDVAIVDANAIDLGPISITGNLQVTSNGAITQNGGILTINGINKTATFAAGSANDITLNNSANDFRTVAITSANNVVLNDVNALNLGTTNLAGNLNITTSGHLTQTGALTLTGSNKTATFDVGSTHDIILQNTGNSFANAIINSANNVTLFDTSALNFGTSSISGNLISSSGAVTQSGTLTVPGTSSFNAGSNAITLTQNNVFGGAVLLTNSGNNNVSITNSGLLTLGSATSSLGSGTLTLTGLGIAQTGPITQAANAGAVTINGGAGAITLGNVGNTFTGAVSLNNSGVNDVLLTNSVALALGTSNVGAGALSLTAGGTISETGAITQAANAGTVTLAVTAPASDILLASQPNDFSGAIVYGGTLSNIRDIGQRNIHLNAGITTTNLGLLTNLRNLTLILDNASMTIPAFTLHNGGSLYIDTSGALSGGVGGDISQTGAAIVPGNATFIAGNHAITLTQANTINGTVFLSNSGNNNVSVVNTSALDIGASSVGSGTLTLTGLGVSQSGAITQESNAVAVAINAGAGAIALENGGNIFTAPVSLNNSGNNNVGLTNSAPLTLAASNVGTGTLSLTSGGTLSETGPLIQAANAGAITLTLTAPSSDILFASQPNNLNGGVYFGGTLSNIRDVGRRNVNANPGTIGTSLALLTSLRNVTIILDNASLTGSAVTLHNGGNLYVDTSGSLSGGTGGNINQLGAVTVPGTVTLIAGAHAITATQSNSIGGDVYLTNSGNNNVAFTTSGLLHLGTSSVGSGTLTLTGLGVTQDGAITQATGAGAATINAGAAAIDLSNTSNIFTGAVSLNNSGNNNIALTNNAALTLGTSNIGSGAFTLTTGGNLSETGAITQAAGAGVFSIASTVPATNIDLSTAANTITGNITFGGTLSNLQDVMLRNISGTAALPTNLTSLVNLRNLILQFDNVGISFPALTLHNGGNLSVIAGNEIDQTGALIIPGTSSFNAGANAITLTQNNIFSGAVSFTNSGPNDIAVTNNGALILGTSNVGTGIFTANSIGVSQVGAFTQTSGAGSATFNAGAGAISLTQNNAFTGSIVLNNSGANDVQLTNTLPIVLGTSSVGSGALGLTSGGNISQTGPLTQAANAGNITFTFTAPNSDLLFANQPNDINGATAFGGTLSNFRDVGVRTISASPSPPATNVNLLTNLRNLTLIFDNTGGFLSGTTTLHSGGNLIFDTSGSLSGGTGGSITQFGGALIVPGTSTFLTGAHAITLTGNNQFSGDVILSNSGNNNVAVTNSIALSIGASNIGSGTLTLTGTGVSQTGAIVQEANAGVATINAGAGAINLTQSNNFTGPVSLNNTGANNVALTTGGGLTIASSSVGTGTLALTAGGNIIESGGISQASGASGITLQVTSPASNIILDYVNDLNGAITFSGTLSHIQDFSLHNINASAALPTNLSSLTNLTNLTLQFNNTGITFPALTLTSGGNLLATSGGAITQTGALTVPGTSSFNSGANPITLTQNNALTGAVTFTNSGANDVNLTTSGALQLAASTIGGNLTSVAGGGITLSGVITAGNSIVLSGTSFTNNAGASALSPGTGNYLVWSANPSSDTRGGLVYNFKQYDATYGVTPVQGTGSGFLYTISPSITPALTGTVTKSYTGTTDAALAASNYTYSGSIDGDVITLNNPVSGTYGSANVGTNINIAVTGISIVSAMDGSATVYGYKISPTTANANIGEITAANLAITANNASKTYGQTTTFVGTEFTSTGLQNGETIGSATISSPGSISTANVASSPYAINISAATGGTFNPANYSISYTDGVLTVNPATLTYTANTASRTYGGVNPALSGTVTGFVNGETQATATTGTMGFTTAAVATSNVGNYLISGGGLAANFGNYTFVQAPGNATAFSILQAPLTVAANDASKSYGQTVTFTGTEFTPTGLQNSETIGNVTLTSTGAISTANVAGSPYSIVSSNATGGTFNPANYSISYTNGALTVNPASLTVAANDATKTYGQTITFTGTEFTPTGLQNGETVGSVTLTSTGAVSTANVVTSPYSIVSSNATGGTFNPANYSISYTNGTLTVNPATLTYVADKATRDYSAQNPALSGTVTGFVLGQTLSTATTGVLAFNTSAITSSTAGQYPIIGSGLTANNNNYVFTQAPGNATAFTVNPATPIVPVISPVNKPMIVNVISSTSGVGNINNNLGSENKTISITINESSIPGGATVPIILESPATKKVIYEPPLVKNQLEGILVKASNNVESQLTPLTPQVSILSSLPKLRANPLRESTYQSDVIFANIEMVKLIITITVIALLGLVSVLIIKTILFQMQVATTNAIANAISKANFNNYLERKKHPKHVVPITNSLDAINLLPKGLPDGYQIIAIQVSRGADKVCVLIGPLHTKALFTITGVSPYYSATSSSITA